MKKTSPSVAKSTMYLRVSFLITVLFSATFVLYDVVTRSNSHRSTAAAADAPKSAFGKHPHGYDDLSVLRHVTLKLE